ncbi:MAG TPA: thiolase domain-containing protein [Flexilinea sp.]|jgi:acetyl-CoA C-acetyltransferase|nr:MAG: putative acetyl-CoA acyltransferase [Chloroflexi bacterium ADurb.Bin344]HNY93525.1 thiolase domain-containing protein [Flexilinea sp.]HPB41101.1 thiolase domain-containing protein [Flexilinea sp.]HPL57654.1 thiolase domain-containing protein [Flexilinea sp.]
MREVAILEIGQTPVSEHWDKSLLELAGEPILQIFEKTGISTVDSIFVGNMMTGSANHQLHLGAYIADWVGAGNASAVHVESACSSGGSAFRAALMAVSSGEADTAIAVGVEKMTDSPSAEITAELATAADADYERDMGVSFVALNALLMRRYMEVYGWKKEDFAGFSINAHANGAHNPNARFGFPITPEAYMKSPPVCDPINVMDAAGMSDGAAAVLLVPVEKLIKGKKFVTIAGSAAATDTIALQDRRDMLWLSAAERSAKEAYRQAGIGPADIDLFEAHDAFTIIEALSLEASGFAERGQGPSLADPAIIGPKGKVPLATMGGLKSRGHPVGATGIYQIVEAVLQLYGLCGENQVPGAKIAMTQNIGGSGSNVYTHILKINEPRTFQNN